MQVVDLFSTSRGVLNTAVVIAVVVENTLDQNIALVYTLPRLFKHQVQEIQKNRTDVSGQGDRERERERDVESFAWHSHTTMGLHSLQQNK